MTHPADRRVLELIEMQGVDFNKHFETDFFLYLPTRVTAEEAAAEARRSGYFTDVHPPASASDRWLCVATRSMRLSQTAMDLARIGFEMLAERLGGEFDGWGAGIPPDDDSTDA